MNTRPKNNLADKPQNIASNPDYSVWVSASAGTGKTKILTDRVLRLLLRGIKPSKILCITFTKAAAAEMTTRITNTLQKWAIASEDHITGDIKILLDAIPSKKQIELELFILSASTS